MSEMMNSETTIDNVDMYTEYITVLTDFFVELEVTNRRTGIETAGKLVSCREITLRITKAELVKLLTDLYEVFEKDETIRTQMDMSGNPMLYSLFGDMGGSYEQFLRSYRTTIRDIEQNYEGDIELLFFIGKNDRLLRIELNTDTEYEGERSQIKATLDLGSSVHDSWVFDYIITTNEVTETISIRWDYEERSGKQNNTVQYISDGIEKATFTSEWEIDGDDFGLTYTAGHITNKMTGSLIIDEKFFLMALDNVYPDNSGESLTITVTATSGSQFEEVEFINLDKWGESIIEALIGLFMNTIF